MLEVEWPHSSQTYSLARRSLKVKGSERPWIFRQWDSKEHRWVKALPHDSHLYGRTPGTRERCICKGRHREHLKDEYVSCVSGCGSGGGFFLRMQKMFTLEKKILLPFLPGFKLATFRSQVWRSNQQATELTSVFFVLFSCCHFFVGGCTST